MLPRLAIALFALFFNYQASADELLMKNGSLLVGTQEEERRKISRELPLPSL